MAMPPRTASAMPNAATETAPNPREGEKGCSSMTSSALSCVSVLGRAKRGALFPGWLRVFDRLGPARDAGRGAQRVGIEQLPVEHDHPRLPQVSNLRRRI